jgi:hypothetical protein
VRSFAGEYAATLANSVIVMRTDSLSTHTQRLETSRKSGCLDVSRPRAFLSHLALSAGIVAVVCALIFFVWYPDPYFQAVGTWNVLRVLVGVDLVLGPVLTLILFKPGKWGLKFDLAFIACVQLAALFYGVTVIYRERPYFTVFAVDRLMVHAYKDVDSTEWQDALESGRLQRKPWRGPLLVVATRPTDHAAYQRLIDETVFRGLPDIDRRPEFWNRYAQQAQQVVARQQPLATLRAARPQAAAAIADVAGRLGLTEERLGFVPMIAKNRDVSMIVDAATGAPLEVIDVDPWIR